MADIIGQHGNLDMPYMTPAHLEWIERQGTTRALSIYDSVLIRYLPAVVFSRDENQFKLRGSPNPLLGDVQVRNLEGAFRPP